MLKAYRTILNLYPARHRAVFEREMLETFAQAQAAWRGRGIAAYGCFVAREFAGLCGGIVREWILQGTAKDRYLIAYPLATAEGELPRLCAGPPLLRLGTHPAGAIAARYGCSGKLTVPAGPL